MLTESQLDGSAYRELWQKQGDQRASPLPQDVFHQEQSATPPRHAVLPWHPALGPGFIMMSGNKHQNTDIHRLGNWGKRGGEEETTPPPPRKNTFSFPQRKLRQVYNE